MTIFSYAQNFEDVLLHRALRDVERGHYVDVGAGHPVHHNVTKLFYDAGWSGANVEPLPDMAAELDRRRPRDLTVQAAASDSGADSVELAVIDQWDELSTIDPSRQAELTAEGRAVTRIPVPVVTLDEVVARLGAEELHFLKVDVEGAELSVLRSLDLGRTRPWIILAEVVSGGSDGPRVELRSHLTGARYRHAYFDGLNDFFVAEERAPQLLPAFDVPVNVTDDFVLASTTDHVVVDLLGARLGMELPVQGAELMQRVEAVLRDRIDFETRLREVTSALEARGVEDGRADALSAQLKLVQEQLTLAQAEARSSAMTMDAMRQTAFERERMIAWYAAEVANHRSRTARLEAEIAAVGAHGSQLQTRIDSLLGSTSWRVSLPVRVARRPGAYLRKLAGR